jgi:hypothetical protein
VLKQRRFLEIIDTLTVWAYLAHSIDEYVEVQNLIIFKYNLGADANLLDT